MFYLTLPSNSSLRHYPENSATHFFTKLPQSVDLSGQYEVGLAEIQFTNNHFNVGERDVYLHYTSAQTNEATEEGRQLKIMVVIPAGLYESNKTFIHGLNKACEIIPLFKGNKKRIKFYYNQATRKASMSMFEEGSTLNMSASLMTILGNTTSTFKGAGHFMPNHWMNLNTAFKSVFVYCDLVSPRPVGDVMVPLLRTLPPIDKKQETVHHIFEKPHYIPLSRFQFNTVEILLTTDTGKEILFNDGHTIVTLHFRRRRLE